MGAQAHQTTTQMEGSTANERAAQVNPSLYRSNADAAAAVPYDQPGTEGLNFLTVPEGPQQGDYYAPGSIACQLEFGAEEWWKDRHGDSGGIFANKDLSDLGKGLFKINGSVGPGVVRFACNVDGVVGAFGDNEGVNDGDIWVDDSLVSRMNVALADTPATWVEDDGVRGEAARLEQTEAVLDDSRELTLERIAGGKRVDLMVDPGACERYLATTAYSPEAYQRRAIIRQKARVAAAAVGKQHGITETDVDELLTAYEGGTLRDHLGTLVFGKYFGRYEDCMLMLNACIRSHIVEVEVAEGMKAEMSSCTVIEAKLVKAGILLDSVVEELEGLRDHTRLGEGDFFGWSNRTIRLAYESSRAAAAWLSQAFDDPQAVAEVLAQRTGVQESVGGNENGEAGFLTLLQTQSNQTDAGFQDLMQTAADVNTPLLVAYTARIGNFDYEVNLGPFPFLREIPDEEETFATPEKFHTYLEGQVSGKYNNTLDTKLQQFIGRKKEVDLGFDLETMDPQGTLGPYLTDVLTLYMQKDGWPVGAGLVASILATNDAYAATMTDTYGSVAGFGAVLEDTPGRILDSDISVAVPSPQDVQRYDVLVNEDDPSQLAVVTRIETMTGEDLLAGTYKSWDGANSIVSDKLYVVIHSAGEPRLNESGVTVGGQYNLRVIPYDQPLRNSFQVIGNDGLGEFVIVQRLLMGKNHQTPLQESKTQLE
jgi:hypothetical protein